MKKEDKNQKDHKHNEKCLECGDGNLCCDSEVTYPAIVTQRGFTCDNCNKKISEITISEKN